MFPAGRRAEPGQGVALDFTLPFEWDGVPCRDAEQLGAGDGQAIVHGRVVQRFRLKIEVVRSLTAQAANHGPGSFEAAFGKKPPPDDLRSHHVGFRLEKDLLVPLGQSDIGGLVVHQGVYQSS